MKLQGSGPSGPKILQTQIRQTSKNRFTFNRLAVVHGRLIARSQLYWIFQPSVLLLCEAPYPTVSIETALV